MKDYGMPAYYNEIDPYAAAWLRNLIAAGHIADGVVDERSIEDVHPIELREFTQCHFFAGIGVWSRALRLAGWADDRPAWTGSCPCQPFSTAGKGAGFADERHLWPAFHHLIAECRPAVVFGEQVASKDGLAWLDLVHVDLERTGYTFGSFDLCAAGVGAPHIRQRLYFVAHAEGERREGQRWDQVGEGQGGVAERGEAGRLAHSEHDQQRPRGGLRGQDPQGLEPWAQPGGRGQAGDSNPLVAHWRDCDWVWCRDEKWRPVEPGAFPLVDGTPGRVERLRAYGNAIVPQVAAEFVGAYLDALATPEQKFI